jgi:hypothetical protein
MASGAGGTSDGWLELSIIAVIVVTILQGIEQFLHGKCSLAQYSSFDIGRQDALF